MNNEPTSRMVLHVPQEDMVRLVQAARVSKNNVHDFVLQAALERAKRVLRRPGTV
jgi:uncharacterized protein (DUF1778 family)